MAFVVPLFTHIKKLYVDISPTEVLFPNPIDTQKMRYLIYALNHRGADKSLDRPGRKQATVSVRIA